MTSLRTPLRLESVLAHTAWLRSLTRSLVVQRDRAEDIMQETLLVAVKHEGAPVCSVRPWLSRVVHNIVRRSHGRETARRVVEAKRASRDPGPSTVDIVAETEMQQRVTAAVLALEDPYRTAILLRFQRGLSYTELARRTGVPVETVRTRIKRALKRLRSELDATSGGCRAWAMPILGVANWERLVPVAGVGPVVVGSVLIGGIVGKSLLAVVAVLAACCLWTFWPTDSDARIEKQALGNSAPQPLAGEHVVSKETAEGARRELAETRRSALATTGSLVVRVIYSEGGKPAVGVGVHVREKSKTDPLFSGRHLRTGESGVLRIRNLDPGAVIVSTDRKQVERPERMIVAGSEAQCTVTIESSFLVSGVVVDEDGATVAGANVFVGGVSNLRPAGAAAKTNPNGRFGLRALRDNAEIQATAVGYAPSPTHSVHGKDKNGKARTEVRLRLVLGGLGGAVEGRVEGPTGASIAGAVVQAGSSSRFRDLLADRKIQSVPPRVFSAQDGTFRIDGLPTGELALLVRAKGLAPRALSCRVVPRSVTKLVVRLEPGLVCEGVVRKHSGEAVSNARVSVGRLTGVMTHFRTSTNVDGSFRLEGLPAGEFGVLANAGDLGRVTAKLRGLEGETIRCDLQLPRVAVLNGRVLTKEGEPLVGASVLVRGTHEGRKSTTTDADGRFSVEDCPDEVSVLVSSHNFALGRKDNVRPSDGELVIRVAGKTDVFIKGKVFDATGRPLVRAMALSLPRRGASFPAHYTDESGSFTVGPVPAGWYRLMVAAQGHARFHSPDRRLAAGETWDVGTIEMAKGSQLAVRFKGQGSKSTPKGLRLDVLDSSYRRGTNIRLRAGVSRSQTLAPGRYFLSVTGPSIATQTIPFVMQTDQNTEVEVAISPGVLCKFHLDMPNALDEFEMVRLTIAGVRKTTQGHWIGRRRGEFDVEFSLAPGEYTVTAVSESGHRAESKVRVSQADGQRFEMRLR